MPSSTTTEPARAGADHATSFNDVPEAATPTPDAATPTVPGTTAGAGAAAKHPPLRRNMQFQMLWIGQATSSLGVSVAEVAFPLAILALTGSPARAGLFAAVQAAGMLLAGLPAGQLADKHDRRTVLIMAQLGRALVTAAVAAGLVMDWLSLPMLLAAAALMGAGQSISGAAGMPLVRSLVPPEQLTTALVQDEVRVSGAALAGPPLAGALYAIRALAHAVPFLFTAMTFVVGLLTAVAMKFVPGSVCATPQHGAEGQGTAQADDARQQPPGDAPDGPDGPNGTRDRGMLTGLATIWGHPVLRAAMTLIMLVNTIGVGLDLVVIVILRQQHVPSGLIGLALAGAAAGGLAGAPLVKPLHKLPPGVLLLSVCALVVPVLLLLTIAQGPWWVAGLLFAAMLGVPALRVLLDVLVLRQAPDRERGRVIGAVMVLMGLGMPAGLAGTGLLLQYLPTTTVLLALTGTLAVGLAFFATRRELLHARWPQ
jgi:MFS family permease